MLNDYISTRDISFNRFALKLYLDNLECMAFPLPETPLSIFKIIAIKMVEQGSNFFSFVEEFDDYISQQSLTPPQQQLLYSIVKEYLKTRANRSFNPEFQDYYETYYSYFKALSRIADNNNTQAVLASTCIPSLLNDLVHRQMLSLSEEIDSLPADQKAKAITTIFKAMTTNNKSKSPVDPGNNTPRQSPQLIENPIITISQP